MASTPMIRVDVGWFLPSILILLMLVLASLGIVAQAATVLTGPTRQASMAPVRTSPVPGASSCRRVRPLANR